MIMRQKQIERMTLVQRLEQVQATIDTGKDNYERFLDITRDNNPLHRNGEYAAKTIFGGIIVPGFFMTLQLEGYLPKTLFGMQFAFMEAARPNDKIKPLMPQEQDSDKKVRLYRVNGSDPELILEGKMVLAPYEEQPSIIEKKGDKVKVYEGTVSEENIADLITMARMVGGSDFALNAHTAAYISPALLKFAKEGTTGAYKRVNLMFHSKLHAGENFTALAEEVSRRGPLLKFDCNVLGEDNRPVITGTAVVVEIGYHEA